MIVGQEIRIVHLKLTAPQQYSALLIPKKRAETTDPKGISPHSQTWSSQSSKRAAKVTTDIIWNIERDGMLEDQNMSPHVSFG